MIWIIFFGIWYLATMVGLLVFPHFVAWFGFSLIYLLGWHWFIMPIHLSLWVVFACFSGLLGIPWIRQNMMIKPLYPWLKKCIPSVSATEQQALSIGDSGKEADVFQGKVQFKRWPKHPLKIGPDEKEFIENETETLCALLDDYAIQEAHGLPKKVWAFMKKNKFFGMIIPTEYGGLAFSPYAQAQVISKIASRSMAAAVTVMVPNSLGPAELLEKYGTQQQKSYYLPRLADGREVPCFALTENEIGSDATSIHAYGTIVKQKRRGQVILGIQLHFNKRYITLAPIATLIGLAFHLKDPQNLLNRGQDLGITLALLPRKTRGVIIGQRHDPLGISFLNGPIQGDHVWIDLEAIIGGQANIGQGWPMLVSCLAVGRGVSLPAVSAGVASLSALTTVAYTRCREQFGRPISQFEGIQEKLAYILSDAYKVMAFQSFALKPLHQGKKPALIASIAKYHMTELTRKIMLHAMDIHGGKAIMRGPKNYLATLYQSLPISITVEGANILTRNLMIFGQGAMRCHPWVEKEMRALWQKESSHAVAVLDALILNHGVAYAQHKLKAFGHQVTAGGCIRISICKHTVIKKQLRHIVRLSKVFAYVVDTTLLFMGGRLKQAEMCSAKLGDVLSELCMAVAIFEYWHDRGQLASEQDLVHISLQTCLLNAQDSLVQCLDNFPCSMLGMAMKWICFPWGKMIKAPSDHAKRVVAQSIDVDHPWLHHIRSNIYMGVPLQDPVALCIKTAQLKIAHQAILDRVKAAVKQGHIEAHQDLNDLFQSAYDKHLITAKEHDALKVYVKHFLALIAVDTFKSL